MCLGVQNISAKEPIFPNIGKHVARSERSQEASVKLLLSHDPTHWDLEVNSKFTDIDVMFSGHTHGLQMGVETEPIHQRNGSIGSGEVCIVKVSSNCM